MKNEFLPSMMKIEIFLGAGLEGTTFSGEMNPWESEASKFSAPVV